MNGPFARLEHYQPLRLECNQQIAPRRNPAEFYALAVIRYSYADIIGRIGDKVRDSEKPLKEIYEAVGISKDQWSRKMALNEAGTGGKKTSFSYDELSRIANYFGADPGWPFIDWHLASANRRAAEALSKHEEQRSPTASSGSSPETRRTKGTSSR